MTRRFFRIWLAIIVSAGMISNVSSSPVAPAAQPPAPVAQQVSSQSQVQVLNQLVREYTSLPVFDLTLAHRPQSFELQYDRVYLSAREMQQLANTAEQSFLRSYPTTLNQREMETNVRIHVLMAIVGARLGYEEFFERHLEVALDRIRRHYGYRGRDARLELKKIADGGQSIENSSLADTFCRQASTILSQPTMGHPRNPPSCLSPDPEPSFFESLLRNAGDPKELVFDRSANTTNLSGFAIRVANYATASPQSILFANALTKVLAEPLVANWFIRFYRDQAVDVPPSSDRQQPPPLYAQQGLVNIQSSDYFVVDRGDRQKIEWLGHVRNLFELKQQISIQVRIPVGEYFVYPTRHGFPAESSLKPNLIVTPSSFELMPGFNLYLSPSESSVSVVPQQRSGSIKASLFKPDFKLIRFNVGIDDSSRDINGGVEFRLFHRINRHLAVQTQLEGVFLKHHDNINPLNPGTFRRDSVPFKNFTSREFQFDIGPVMRFNGWQLAIMESFRLVNRSGWDSSGEIGQFFFNLGYLIPARGQVGLYATRANKQESVVNRVRLETTLFEEIYLRVTDQIGVNFNIHLGKGFSVEGAFGHLDTIRLKNAWGGVVRTHLPPIWKMVKLTTEFGFNEGFVAQSNNWRFGVGVRFGEWGRAGGPARSTALGRSAGPEPVFVPRVRYETLTRVVRDGNRRPVADAGPDQLGLIPSERLPGGVLGRKVVIDGSSSFDPDGDEISYEWTKLDDCPDSITFEDLQGAGSVGPASAAISFAIKNGDSCSVQLIVEDSLGLKGDPDIVRVSVQRGALSVIISFIAQPGTIPMGAESTLSWETRDAETVEITNVSNSSALPVNGSVSVTPSVTTTYVLSACNAAKECATAQTTVVVKADLPGIVSFIAQPGTIPMGAESTLSWETRDAETVEITNVSNSSALPVNGSVSVTPSVTTTYVLSACNAAKECATAQTTVVVKADLPGIVSFIAQPGTIPMGAESTLSWETRDAETVEITNVSNSSALPVNGSVSVTPSVTTTYVLSACNAAKECTTAQTTVVVKADLPGIVSFIVQPGTIRVGAESTLSWEVRNATRVDITNSQDFVPPLPSTLPLISSGVVMPSETTTYTLTASNDDGATASAQLTVLVLPVFPQILSFAATPTKILTGECTTLSWATEAADSVFLTNLTSGDTPIAVNPDDSVIVCPTQTTSFTLTATNSADEVSTAQVTVYVQEDLPVIFSFTAKPADIIQGQSSELCWEVENVERVSITNIPNGDNLPAMGCKTVQPPGTTTYTLTAVGRIVVQATVTVLVRPPFPFPGRPR